MTTGTRRLRIGWFVAGGKESTLSSHCSQCLLPALRDRYEIELFTDEVKLDLGELSRLFPVHHYITAFRRHREAPFDLFFYQLEDGKDSRFVRMHIGLIPGVVWIHDLFLHDAGPEGLRTSPWEQTIAQYDRLGKDLTSAGELPHTDETNVRLRVANQLGPCAYREVSLAPVALFSNRWAMAESQKLISGRIEPYPGGQRVEFLPVPIPVSTGGEPSLRKGEMAPGDARVFHLASIGGVGVEDQSYKLLPALRDLSCAWHLTWLVDHDEVSRARELLEEFSVTERVSIEEGRSVEAWRTIVERSDCALHLHRSPFGHLSPYLQLSLAAGAAVVVSDAFEGSMLPADRVYRVVPDLSEGVVLRELFGVLSRTPRERAGQLGREFVEREWSVPQVAERLAQLFDESAPNVQRCMERWNVLEQQAADALINGVLASFPSLSQEEAPSHSPEAYFMQRFSSLLRITRDGFV
jgi:hypothetical protein